jgi:subtilase family serine protease
MQLRGFDLPLATVFLTSLFAAPCATAQSSATVAASRVTSDWRTSASVAIADSKPPSNAFATDLGTASSSQNLSRILLLLKPSSTQQQALTSELASLQNSASSNNHQWLTPAAFAQSYAVSATDAAAVVSWLESEGFAVESLPAGRGWIEFSGTVAQVERTFSTTVQLVSVSGTKRAVIENNISLPSALAPVIAGLVSLDGSLAASALTTPESLTTSSSDLAALTSPSGAAALTPKLAAQLVDLTSLNTAGVTGTGETVAIASRSNVNSSDVAAFRTAFGVATSPLKVTLNGSDPGLTDDQAAATLAASWAGAVAPGAQIQLVPAASTLATDGVDLSLAAIVDQNLANVVAVGYSACESGLSSAHQQFYTALYQQAAAEGITIIAASGDGGAAACTPAGGTATIGTGYGVNALASTQWNTVVGAAGYGTSGATAGATALAAWSPVSTADPAYAGGGGQSTLYTRPSWQSASTQKVASDASSTSKRLLPDLALPTALDTSTNTGLAFCLSSDASSGSGCTLVRAGGSGSATAYFAGVAALIDQKYGAVGNLAPLLYVTSQSASASGVFNDVAQGTTQLSCTAGSTGCSSTGQIGYSAASGATGEPSGHLLRDGGNDADSDADRHAGWALQPNGGSHLYDQGRRSDCRGHSHRHGGDL